MTTHLTPEQVSDRYSGRITVDTLAQWRWRKKGPRYMKAGRAVLYRLSDLEDWEAKQVIAPGASEAPEVGRR